MFKDAKASYFADLISSNEDNLSELLFDTISDIVPTAPFEWPVSSNENYSSFLLFFVDEVRDIRVSVIPSSTRLDHSVFEMLFVRLCAEPQWCGGHRENLSSSWMFYQRPCLRMLLGLLLHARCLLLICWSLSHCVPSYFKQAVVRPPEGD